VIVGEVRSVEKGGSQTELTAAAPAGATTLTVEMAEGNFNEDGGQLLLNGNTYDYDTIDVETDIITLTAPLPVAAAIDDPVQAVDAGATETTWTALVAIDDGDPIPANIPTDKIAYFPEGTYDQPMQVGIDVRGDGYEVVSQPLRDPSFDGGAVWNPHSFRDLAAATIPNNLAVDITAWGNGETDGIIATSGGYTIQYPGVYFLSVIVGFVVNDTGRRRVHLHCNGPQIAIATSTADPSANTFVATSRQIRLAELDVITVQVSQDSGAGLALLVGNAESTFAMHRVSV
jgi:hypothetical protein